MCLMEKGSSLVTNECTDFNEFSDCNLNICEKIALVVGFHENKTKILK